MNCPQCKTKMEEGRLQRAHWISGKKPKLFLGVVHPTRKVEYVVAWRCPKCGKVELYSSKV